MKNIEKDKEKSERPEETGWPPGSIGDISARIGCDVRDLKMAGCTDDEINEVLNGKRTLEALLKSKPRRQR